MTHACRHRYRILAAGFPFPSAHIPKLCYKTKAQASAGEGPCGSWCTQDIKVGSGCGDNSDHLCDASTAPVCHRNLNISACEVDMITNRQLSFLSLLCPMCPMCLVCIVWLLARLTTSDSCVDFLATHTVGVVRCQSQMQRD